MSTEIIETPGSELAEVIITREVKASPKLIFTAFMDPEQLAFFWGPDGMSTPSDKILIEAWPGGRFETVMVNDATGEEYPTSAKFVEIDEPNSWSWLEPQFGLVSTTTLADMGNGMTKMVIHQTNVPAMFRSPEALAGFNTAIDKLERYFEERS